MDINPDWVQPDHVTHVPLGGPTHAYGSDGQDLDPQLGSDYP